MDPLIQELIKRFYDPSLPQQDANQLRRLNTPKTGPTEPLMGMGPLTPRPIPAIPPSGGVAHIPPEGQRFLTSQAMMNAVRNGQSPLLTQIASTPK